MRLTIYFLLIFALLLPLQVLGNSQSYERFSTESESGFFALCYHDVKPYSLSMHQADEGTVTTRHLVEHFEWLKDNGYTVVSLDEVIKAKSEQKALPEKAVLLTFDDGYRSFYTQIFPLLKLYNYPATFAIVTSWIESSEAVNYGGIKKATDDFLTWQQIREMQQSGLIEIASHSHDMHRGLQANPQGNTQPAAVSREFSSDGYETDSEFEKRIIDDLQTSFDVIKQQTGKAPRAIVWPYGSYSEYTWSLAQSIGFQQSLVLEKGTNTLTNNHIQRHLVSGDPSDIELGLILDPYSYKAPHRAVHIDLDYVYDPDPVQQHKNLSLLLDRVKALNVTHVYLQAFADPDGDGNASALYFPNRHLPVRADLFNRVAWQLKTRSNVKVLAWMPVMAFDLGADVYQRHGVKALTNSGVQPSVNNYQRLSIFDETSRQIIKDIYQDLAKYSQFAGVLFHDDAFLSDFEDVGPEALAYYQSQGLEFESIQELRSELLIDKWTAIKTQALINFTHELADIIRQHNGETVTARNIYAQPVMKTAAKRWFAQDLNLFTENYDFTAVMAMPYMEQAVEPQSWFMDLLKNINKQVGRDKVVIELQAYDWAKNKPVSNTILLEQIKQALLQGFINIAYYPDDFINNHPQLKQIIQGVSTSSFPQRETAYE
ncbi:poly-beta-1,6-N-acetyl-D-glucosamine N-deacetylase PgaB [Kangiella profundi]|uniref:Poly-beta-1,6-N-acetyl-D-glucosamine N-deacetylase PgaB n=1 Tax=Kangiella profundi TaxID=1561924 RepID=A0A2K9B1I4_9GAMM|nr:poly-beta-1,6-N-acetyl-D-glucosamine N-deacetylase PgaB [Kangiella profundi]AUD78758.1 poly-beta-1,6-N-acetyl-D-glucosamine N-deacetylase PgaB [Kangiella profundi]GGF04452.1 poly-beta-1,6-N-acetyl-D-glucosamine N-deacetylase PgaB [Kangiella profundi]